MKDFMYNFKLTWRFAKDQKSKVIMYSLLNVLEVIISVVIPILNAKIIINLTTNLFNQLLFIAFTVFMVENVRNLIHYKTRHYAQIIYKAIFAKVEIELSKEILKLENKVVDDNGSGVFIQRFTNDAGRVSEIFYVLNTYLTNIITDIGIFGTIFIINKVCFIFVLLSVIIIYFIEKTRVDLYNEKDKEYRKKYEKISGFVGEIVRGCRDIKMLNAEDSFTNELENKIYDMHRMRYEMQDVDRKYSLLRGFTIDLSDLLLIILLIYIIKIGRIEVALALIVYNYYGRVRGIVNYVGMLLERVKDYNLSCSRIYNIFDSDEFSKESFGDIHLDTVNGDFEFKNVYFSYDKKNKVLKGINFKVNANETVAFVGKSGAGKSTIFSLLCKMYEPSSGKIMIDGVDIKKLDKDSIRGNITIISQNPYIFNLSIRDNLRLVKKDLTEKEMIDACKVACLDDFIKSLPDGYDTIVGEGGLNLSGGQKQRLAIARALVQKTEIILFDEATSALDNETQSKIQEAISNMKGEYTILMIAHRLSTIVNANRILYIDDGKVVASGTHKELLKNCLEYKKLYKQEISKKDDNPSNN